MANETLYFQNQMITRKFIVLINDRNEKNFESNENAFQFDKL